MPDVPPMQQILETHSEALRNALPEYLVRQRWFGGKSRKINSAVPTISRHFNDVNAVMMNVAVAYEDGSGDSYQLPLAIARSADFGAPAISAIASFAAGDGEVSIYDASQSAEFRAALLQAVEDSDLGELPSKVSSSEQSNTSIIYGGKAILKLYRRLQVGENPDVEISRFLTQVAHFEHIPAYLGQLRADDGTTLAFLQAFAPNEGDGWEWIQSQLTSLLQNESSSVNTGPTLEAAALLGRRTAEMHLALATETPDPAFAPEQFTTGELSIDSTRLRSQITNTLDALKANLHKVPAESTAAVAQLLGKRKQLLDLASWLATASPYRLGRRLRVHGDYHLGQVLRTADDFLIVDFEGEPARPLEERRRKQSPLRDVAGMLRSFSYAAASAAKNQPPAKSEKPSLAVKQWELAACAAFLNTYRDVMEAVPELLPQAEQMQSLLRAFVIEKALYELLYELNNRPTWLRIPLDGILSLLDEAH